MVQAVTLFKTTDGKTFDDANAAEAHEAGLIHADLINAYMEQAGELKKPQAALLRKHLAMFILFDAQYGKEEEAQAA